jgi:hypothetical protein
MELGLVVYLYVSIQSISKWGFWVLFLVMRYSKTHTFEKYLFAHRNQFVLKICRLQVQLKSIRPLHTS